MSAVVRRLPILIALVVMALLALFTIVPIAALIARGVNFSALFSDPATGAALRGTLETSLGAALLSFALGLPLAVVLERTDLPFRRALKAAFTLPTAIPPYIWCMGWISLANPKAGLFNRVLGAGTFDIYGAAGIAFVLGSAGLPLVMLPAAAMLERIDPSLEEAARVSGAGPAAHPARGSRSARAACRRVGRRARLSLRRRLVRSPLPARRHRHAANAHAHDAHLQPDVDGASRGQRCRDVEPAAARAGARRSGPEPAARRIGPHGAALGKGPQAPRARARRASSARRWESRPRRWPSG